MEMTIGITRKIWTSSGLGSSSEKTVLRIFQRQHAQNFLRFGQLPQCLHAAINRPAIAIRSAVS
jgi:hypothetical protein